VQFEHASLQLLREQRAPSANSSQFSEMQEVIIDLNIGVYKSIYQTLLLTYINATTMQACLKAELSGIQQTINAAVSRHL